MTRSLWNVAAVAAASVILAACASDEPASPAGDVTIPPNFVPTQPELFDVSGAQPNTWVDYDLDGDLDLFVGFRGRPNRLYRNDAAVFVDVAADVGLADEEETRAAAWGDYDLDGDLDVYVGFAADAGKANRLYRNDPVEGGGRHFTDVAPGLGLDRVGTTRQPVFVDWDGDGDQDLFVAFRDQPNRLYRNEGGTFTDVTDASGAGDPRRTVGAVWFDMDGDGDLDLFTANQNGDEDGVFRNQGDGTFTDVAADLGMNQPGRTEEQGSVGVAVADYDNDGDLDLFVASYGPDVLWQNQGDGTFVDVAPGTPLASDHHSVAAAWGDYDNDGWVDLYVDRYLNTEPQTPDALFRNVDGAFEEVTPPVMLEKGGTHGVAWADFDMDGDVDLALANNSEPGGTDPLYVNGLPAARAARSLQVLVLDSQSRWMRAGAEVTVRQEMLDGSAGSYRSARLMEAGGGYSSQGGTPIHFGLPDGVTKVSVTVAWFERGERRTAMVNGVEPMRFQRQWLTLRLGVQ
ncbi:MAG TPA: CRTAC1 family protein [Longimicrobiales bacterium]|nr:CRTAC1 family protein [Longimicrobiales bacterium]